MMETIYLVLEKGLYIAEQKGSKMAGRRMTQSLNNATWKWKRLLSGPRM